MILTKRSLKLISVMFDGRVFQQKVAIHGYSMKFKN
jgi:hypothetical protein